MTGEERERDNRLGQMHRNAIDAPRSEAGEEWIRSARGGEALAEWDGRYPQKLVAPASPPSEDHRAYGNPHLKYNRRGEAQPKNLSESEKSELYADGVLTRRGFVVESYGEHPSHALGGGTTGHIGPAGRRAAIGNAEEHDTSYLSPSLKPELRTADRIIDGMYFEHKMPVKDNVGNFVNGQLGAKAAKFEKNGTQADRFVVNLDSENPDFRSNGQRGFGIDEIREEISQSKHRYSIKEVLAVYEGELHPVWPPPPGWRPKGDHREGS